MSDKQEDKPKTKEDKNDDDIPKPQPTSMAKKDENKEDERSLEEIEKELDELRPQPPSPKTQHRIEEEEKIKDHQLEEQKDHKGSSVPIEAKSSNEEDGQQHKDNELTPGEPDPTVNDNVKIPVLDDRGDVELKPQQGSALNKNKNNNATNNNQPSEEDKNNNSTNNNQPSEEDKKNNSTNNNQPSEQDKNNNSTNNNQPSEEDKNKKT